MKEYTINLRKDGSAAIAKSFWNPDKSFKAIQEKPYLLEEGMKVKVNSGPFKGMFGTVDTIDLDNDIVNLTIDLFGQDTQVEVSTGQISKA